MRVVQFGVNLLVMLVVFPVLAVTFAIFLAAHCWQTEQWAWHSW